MWLDDFIPSESWPTWPQSQEISEKFKEAVKKSSAWIKRVQKDEKKARKFDLLLASFLVEIVKNPKYDFLLNNLFKTINSWFSSNFILWLISLIHTPISKKIRELSKKEFYEFNYTKTFDTIDFYDELLDNELKNKINYWIEDIIDIISLEYSNIQIKTLQNLFQNKESYFEILELSCLIFQFFFKELNINITLKQSNSYIDFLLKEVYLKITNLELEEV